MKSFFRSCLLSGLCALVLSSCEKKEPVPEVINISKVLIGGEYAVFDSGAYSAVLAGVTDFTSIRVVVTSNAARMEIGGREMGPDGADVDLSSPQTLRLTLGSTVEEYTVSARNTGLPIVRIDTGGRGINSKEEWLKDATIRIEQADGTVDLEGGLDIRGRGNSTWNYPKKPYALKLKEKASVLSMPAHKRWILLANWKDRTLLRNDAAFWLSKHTGLPYTVRGQFVEVVLNGQHKGNYYLCEQIKEDKNRVDIDKKTGYLLELDSYYDEPYKFRNPDLFDLPWMVKYPDEEDITPEQFQYIQDWIRNLEVLMKDTGKVKEHAYEEFFDVDTAIDYLIVEELTTNHDFYNTWPAVGPHSCYMYIGKDGRLYTGPAWDFDYHVWVPQFTSSWQGADKTLFYPALLKDEKFRDRLLERWDLQKDALKALPDYIDQMADYIRLSEEINHRMWPIVNNPENGDEEMTFQEAIDRIKKAFQDKWAWMDKNIASLR